mmetsp:Transcript_34682/g.38716  ORF Transcript_34682/g.38716 Transcript_34682/m.38716 type:complete len:323 (+) Transcript_34682:360-1328(+)
MVATAKDDVVAALSKGDTDETAKVLLSSLMFHKEMEGQEDGFELDESSEYVYGGKYPFVDIAYNMDVPGSDFLSRVEHKVQERLGWEVIVLSEDGNIRKPDGQLITSGRVKLMWTYDEKDGTLYFHFFFDDRLLTNARDHMKPRTEGDYSAWDCVGVRFWKKFGFTLDEASSSFDASDRIAMQDLMANYAAGLDTKDRKRFGNVFAEDVEASFPLSPDGPLKGREAWLDFIWPVINRFSATQHMIGSHTVTKIDGDTAETRNSVQAVHFFADNDLRYTIWATYHTTMRRVKSVNGTSSWQISKYRAETVSTDYSTINSAPPS